MMRAAFTSASSSCPQRVHRKRFLFRLFGSTCPSSAQVSLESIAGRFSARLPVPRIRPCRRDWPRRADHLPPGRYAVNAFHDENGNGESDTNLLGIPAEGYGFANDPVIRFGPPDFEAAAVSVGENSEVAVLTLNY